jgi:hypothetical protein
MSNLQSLTKELHILWELNLKNEGVKWPKGEGTLLKLLCLFAHVGTKMSQDEMSKWIEFHGGRYDRQARHLAASGWYLVSGSKRVSRMQRFPALEIDDLMLVSVEEPNPIWVERLQQSRAWELHQDEWDDILQVFLAAGRGCAVCGRHFDSYDKGHLDPNLPYEKRNLVPMCVECNNWAGAHSIHFKFNSKTLVARPIVSRGKKNVID